MAERPGVVLSWPEAFRIVPELAQAEVERILVELDEAKEQCREIVAKHNTDTLQDLRRVLKVEAHLKEAIRYGGIGDAAAAMGECRAALEALEVWPCGQGDSRGP